MLSDAVGSSSSSNSGWPAIARAMAISCRWPPDSERMLLVVSVSGMPSRLSTAEASECILTSDSMCLRRSLPSSRFEAISRLSHRDRSCQTTPTPCRAAETGSAGSGLPPSRISPLLGAMSPARQRTSVVLPAPFSPASATTSPALISRSIPSSARTGPKLTARFETLTTDGTPDVASPSGPPGAAAAARAASESAVILTLCSEMRSDQAKRSAPPGWRRNAGR